MRIVTLAVSAVCLGVATLADGAELELKTEEQKTFYAIGLAVSRSLETFNLSEGELELVKAGLTDALLRRPRKVEVQAYVPRIQELQKTRVAATVTGERKAGDAFLARAAAEKGATRVKTGFVIITLKPGGGASPQATDKVKVHYHGTLVDGTVFDSSVQRGEPVTFPLNGVIPCWAQGVALMKVGGKSRLVCPPELAYGDRGAPPRIKPGATLVFEVELLEIVK
jgi:FKBP-type peptidyl-prolyl cis-trans isomerase FkpA/FKBP-type peptidyl-prolyl cis-trans isomerase FklB